MSEKVHELHVGPGNVVWMPLTDFTGLIVDLNNIGVTATIQQQPNGTIKFSLVQQVSRET